MNDLNIEKVIQSIRDSFEGAEHVYQNGSCWYFANILRTIFPTGVIYENFDHCVFKYKKKYYDIQGEVNPKRYPHLKKAMEPTLTEKFDMFLLIRELK
jgi:hypothetical protein